jgi:hypothetical protein
MCCCLESNPQVGSSAVTSRYEQWHRLHKRSGSRPITPSIFQGTETCSLFGGQGRWFALVKLFVSVRLRVTPGKTESAEHCVHVVALIERRKLPFKPLSCTKVI